MEWFFERHNAQSSMNCYYAMSTIVRMLCTQIDLFVKNLNANLSIHINNPHFPNNKAPSTSPPSSSLPPNNPPKPSLFSPPLHYILPQHSNQLLNHPKDHIISISQSILFGARKGEEELRMIIIINISQSMSAKRSFYGQKDFNRDRDETHTKKSDDTPDEKVRILQDNLVFVNALPADSSTRETLQKDTYFGRYGPVCKLILNPPYPNKKGFTYQAYVTYGCELDAALAIVSLDGYKLADRPLKVSFGTTKYCSHFLRGHDCPNADCFYLHRLDRKREVGAGETKIVFKEQNTKAVRIVLAHLEEVAGRILDSDIEDQQEGFPSLSEVMDYLVDKQYLSQGELDQAFEDAHTKRSQSEQIPTQLETRGVSLPDPHHERQSQRLNKSNSHSTMCTPSKNMDEDELQRKKQPGNPPPPQQPQQVQMQSGLGRGELKQRCQRLIQSLKQNIVDKQNQLGARELQIQQKIEKLIIKEILKKGNNQCRSRFIKNATASREDQNRFRGIVQKYLITHN